MLINMYVIFDTKAKFYNKPFYLQNDSIAVRAFSDLANDPQTDVYKHPTDFQLFKVGTYEDTTAKINPIIPEHLANAHELKNKEEETQPQNEGE